MKRSVLLAILSILGIVLTWWLTRDAQPADQLLPNVPAAEQAAVQILPQPDSVFDDGSHFSRLWDPVSYHVLHPVPPESSLADVTAVWRHRDQIWLPILEGGPRVLVFSPAGEYIRTLRLDEDPGEYTAIALHPASGLISLSHPEGHRLRLYDLEGQWQRDIRVPFRFLSATLSPNADRILFCLAGEGDVSSNVYASILTDGQGQVIREVLPVAADALAHPALLPDRFQFVPDGVLYSPLFSTQLVRIDFSGDTRWLVEVPVFDHTGWMLLDSVSGMPASLRQVLALRNALPVESFLWHPEYLIIGGIWGKVNHDMVLELKTGRHVQVPNGALLTQFGPAFNFGYMRPRFVWDGTFYTLFKAVDYQQILSHIEDPAAIAHLPAVPAEDAWVVMAHAPNREVWFPADIPQPPGVTGKQMLLRPNPASGRTEVVLEGMTGDGTLEVVDLTGVVRHAQPVRQVERIQPMVLSTAGWSSGAYLVRWIQGDEVTVQKLMVQ